MLADAATPTSSTAPWKTPTTRSGAKRELAEVVSKIANIQETLEVRRIPWEVNEGTAMWRRVLRQRQVILSQRAAFLQKYVNQSWFREAVKKG